MASPTVHLMWKEYRTLRPLWLVFVGITAAILLALVAARMANAADVTINDWPSIAVAGLAYPTLMFVPIALCLLFAAETEERTSQLLFQLAPTWRQLMVGKLLPVMIATAALWISLLAIEMLAALLLWLSSSGVSDVSSLSKAISNVPTEPRRIVALGIIGCLWLTVPALLWSLITRRVISAVLCTLLSMWFLAGIVAVIIQHPSASFTAAAACFITLLSIILVSVFSIRWHRGWLPRHPRQDIAQASDFAFATGQNQATSSGGWSLWRWICGILGAWQFRYWLQSISRQPHSTRRMATVLLWKEIRCSLPVLAGWLAAGLALVLISQTGEIRFRAGLLTAFASLFCLELGLRTYRKEHSDGTLLFAAERGLAPQLMWCVKVGFGLFEAVMCTWLVIGLDNLIPVTGTTVFTNSADQRPSGGIAFFLHRLEQLHPSMNAGFGLLDASQIPLAMVVTCFVTGLICSAWIRSGVLSFAMGISMVTALWLFIVPGCIKYDLPLTTLLVPVTGLWALMSLLTARQTVELRRSTRLDWWRIGVIVVPAMVAFAASGWIRMNQVPADVGVGNPIVFGMHATESAHFPWYHSREPSSDKATQQLVNSRQHGDPADSSEQSNPWLELWNWRSMTGMTTYSHRFDQPAWVDLQMVENGADQATVPPGVDRFNRLRSLSESEAIATMPLELQNPWSVLPSMTIAECAVQNARSLIAERKFAEAADSLVDGARLIRIINKMSANWDQWATNCLAERTVLREVAAWAANDQISEEVLRATHRQLSDVLQNELSPASMLSNRYFFMVACLWNPEVKALRLQTGVEHLTHWQQTPATEKARFVKLLQLITLSGLSEFGTEADRAEVTSRQDDIRGMHGIMLTARLLQTSPDFGLNLNDDLAFTLASHHPSQRQQTLWSTVTAERAALLILELQTWRRRHGHFPESLEMLTAEDWISSFPRGQADLPLSRFFVPDSGLVFGYSATGINDPVAIPSHNGDIRIIPANQPMLWSYGQPEAVSFATRHLSAHGWLRWMPQALKTQPARDAQTFGTTAAITFDDHTLQWQAADPSLIHLNW